MPDDCPMTQECPGFDRDARVCLLRPGDCEFAPADADAVDGERATPTAAAATANDRPSAVV